MKKFERPILILAILLLAGALVFSYFGPNTVTVPILPSQPTPYPIPGKTTPAVVLVPTLTKVRPFQPKDSIKTDTMYIVKNDTLTVVDSAAQHKLDSIYANSDTLQYDGSYDYDKFHISYRILSKGPVISFSPVITEKQQSSSKKNFTLAGYGGATVLNGAYFTYGASASYKGYSGLWMRHGSDGHTAAVGLTIKF